MGQGRIPQDVLDEIFQCCEPETDDGRIFHRVLKSYEQQVELPNEPTFRRRLAEVYCRIVPAENERLLTRRQRRALERCAEGEFYAEED